MQKAGWAGRLGEEGTENPGFPKVEARGRPRGLQAAGGGEAGCEDEQEGGSLQEHTGFGVLPFPV